MRAISLFISLLCYAQICVLIQCHFLNPFKSWKDDMVSISALMISISLRSLMMNSLSNFIVYIGKQLILWALHPNKSLVPVYPRIDWMGG